MSAKENTCLKCAMKINGAKLDRIYSPQIMAIKFISAQCAAYILFNSGSANLLGKLAYGQEFNTQDLKKLGHWNATCVC